MKNLLLGSLLGAALCGASASAQSFAFNFDAVPSGTLANSVLPGGLTVEPAFYGPSFDTNGDPIPGSDAWRVDSSAPAVVLENPLAYDRGTAPSPANALNALFQPVMFLFPTPRPVGLFRTILDGDEFGSVLPIEFYDSNDVLLRSINIDQSVPYLQVSDLAGIGGVSKIVLPAGAFYDNVLITAVPEVNSSVLVGGALIGVEAWLRRRA
jgi:hypothetical protein